MQNIALPKKIDFKAGNSDGEGQIIVEPLYPGYGMTLGNSLRRVLLSSLPGAAVVGVRIKGTSHEFTALSGVKEDILEIVLNLKQLRLRMFTENDVVLTLKAKGLGPVTAAAITANSEVEIKNPELVIANLTEDNASLEMEITVKEGRGYKMSESGKRENELGYIEVDSIFSPVLSVSIDVDNTRVGKMTNWDKLVLNIKTDKTITPKEAFDQSVRILVDQFSALLPGALAAPAPVAEEEVAPEAAEEEPVAAEEKPAKKKAKK